MLNIKDALRLYALLKDFIPEYDVDGEYLEFVSAIVHNIRTSDRPEVFGESILLMNPRLTVEELSKMMPLDAVALFMEGITKNKFFGLRKFCKALGYD